MSSEPLGVRTTKNKELQTWVSEMAALCQPDALFWCDGSESEHQALCKLMVERKMFTKLNEQKRPNSYLTRSHPSDVARIEERTYICSATREDAGPTNN